jgi:glycosyltransferase involved in cell wall biosynthesis
MTANAFIEAGVAPDLCLVAHNGFAPSLMYPRLDRASARQDLDLPIDVPLVVYAGHVGPEKGTAALVSMAAHLPSARFVIVGTEPGSPTAAWAAEAARRAGAANVMLRPRVRLSEVAAYLYAADCLVIPPTDEPLRRFRGTVLPMKIFGYLAAGRPILAPRLPDLEEILLDDVNACLVPPDAAEAAAALDELLTDRSRQDRLAENALAASRQYTWTARARRILNFLGVDQAAVSTDTAGLSV